MTNPSTWILKPRQKKSVEEHVIFERDNQQLIRIEGYRDAWAFVTSDTDQPPQFDFSNPDGLDVLSHKSYESIQLIDNGWYVDFQFPNNMSQEEQDLLVNAWDLNYDQGLEQHGWAPLIKQCWFFGELELVHESWANAQDYKQA